MSASGVEVPRICDEGANFILRRAVPFLPKPPARERQRETTRDDYYERSSTLEDKSRCGRVPTTFATTDDGGGDLKSRAPASNGDQRMGKDVGHKTVIYFGDTNPRQREGRANWQPPPPPPLEDRVQVTTPKCNENPEMSSQTPGKEIEAHRDQPMVRENDGDNGAARDSAIENDPTKVVHEIVVKVSPSREDVLRIEEEESQLEDYWSLPGDTSGFKADWSFVQQWRLRG